MIPVNGLGLPLVYKLISKNVCISLYHVLSAVLHQTVWSPRELFKEYKESYYRII